MLWEPVNNSTICGISNSGHRTLQLRAQLIRIENRWLLIFLIGVALTNTFGRIVGDPRQGWTLFAALTLAAAMFAGRFLVIVPVLCIAGTVAAKRRVPVSAGTLPTHGTQFVTLLVGTIVIVGGLTFLPPLALGRSRNNSPCWLAPRIELGSVAARAQ